MCVVSFFFIPERKKAEEVLSRLRGQTEEAPLKEGEADRLRRTSGHIDSQTSLQPLFIECVLCASMIIPQVLEVNSALEVKKSCCSR